MNPVTWFEMPYEDRERMTRFYEAAFKWEMINMGTPMGNYVIAHTTETDADGMSARPGAINGGFFPKQADKPAQYPSVVVAVENIEAAMESVTKAGGKVLGEPVDIPGTGRYVAFTDTEGNRASLLQPTKK